MPIGHGRHTSTPRAVLYVPTRQARHPPDELKPVPVLNVPDEQSVQVLAWMEAPKVPLPQRVQTVLPF